MKISGCLSLSLFHCFTHCGIVSPAAGVYSGTTSTAVSLPHGHTSYSALPLKGASSVLIIFLHQNPKLPHVNVPALTRSYYTHTVSIASTLQGVPDKWVDTYSEKVIGSGTTPMYRQKPSQYFPVNCVRGGIWC